MGDILCHSPLWSSELSALGVSHVSCMGPSVVARLTTSDGLLGMLVPSQGGCQALPCVEAAGPWLAVWSGGGRLQCLRGVPGIVKTPW